MNFVNRHEEMAYLEEKYASSKHEFIIMYGKRRVGKTTLLLEWLRRHNGIYYMAEQLTRVDQLRQFSTQVGRFLNDPFIAERGFASWKQAFEYLLTTQQTITVVIDEFPYLVESDKNVPIEFQFIIDHLLKTASGKTRLKLIIAGSSISMMERLTLAYRSPLYGRKTGLLDIEPMSYQPLQQYFARKHFTDVLNIYALCGGIPLYWEQYNIHRSFWHNVTTMTLTKNALLKDEVELLLYEELREPTIYFSLLKTIAFGAHKLSEITARSGLKPVTISKYLANLQTLRFIRREIPFGHHLEKSKSGLYFLAENFIQFWFRYILPNRDLIAEGRTEPLLKLIQQDFLLFRSKVYEQMIKQVLQTQEEALGFKLTRARRYWDKTMEIDLIGVDDEQHIITFVEVKDSQRLMPLAILNELQRKAKAFIQPSNFSDYQPRYILCSTSGFTTELRQIARSQAPTIWLVHGDKII